MRLPEKFAIIYEAKECGDQIELTNCFVNKIPLFCLECRATHYYYSEQIRHLEWEWDSLELTQGVIDASIKAT